MIHNLIGTIFSRDISLIGAVTSFCRAVGDLFLADMLGLDDFSLGAFISVMVLAVLVFGGRKTKC
jgi:hypothetical protein